MKLSKFVKRAKSESYCVVIHADDSGIWLGTRLALYNATELPYMEGKEQAGAVLDIDSKAWEKMFFDEKYTAHAGADFGMNLTETDPTEQEARRVPLEMFYKGMGLVGLMLSAEELKITESVPLGGREALEHEMKILKFREHKILAKIAEYEGQPEDALFVSSLLDMRTPGGRGKDKKDGANQTMGMYSKDSAFSRVLKLQEALYKVQGRIAKIADSLRALEESDRRMALEKQRLEILRMRATGAVDVPDPDGTAADDLDAPLEEDTEE